MSFKYLPETTAYVHITHQSWQQGQIAGEVSAAPICLAVSVVFQARRAFR